MKTIIVINRDQFFFHQRPTSRASSTDSSENGELDSPTGLNKLKTALVGKGKTQSSGRIPSFLYNGAAGSMGLGHGDHNFPGAPALLQDQPLDEYKSYLILIYLFFYGINDSVRHSIQSDILHFTRSQHPGGMGVSAVGMAFLGYVGQPGFGNSEMTWLPVLAGAAGGALRAPYSTPYLTVDSSYYNRPLGQAFSFGGSRLTAQGMHFPSACSALSAEIGACPARIGLLASSVRRNPILPL
ncbi:hypothetical protein GIB67_016954 [Kingdonia uniflora]|uniref:Uncharacterized protein n=1 Tax=Kingdonia uniflora TaxID=39325 RepID=A0A7J7M3J8_9MAGN|nr:hypothetical protein GIB67_016954 [Kingdonia uniflora]